MKSTLLLSALASSYAFAGSSGDSQDTPIVLDEAAGGHGHHARPDSHAPIGVMADHTHGKGEFMASYRYMFMSMEQHFDGSSTVSDATVLQDFAVTPTRMDMQMHMLGLMFAPTDRLTLVGMVSAVDLRMDHVTRTGQTFTTESSGIGDSSIGGLYQFHKTDRSYAHFGLMALLPTADIDNRDDTPLGVSQLPYPMQLGSGSWGIAPSITYTGFSGDWSYGGQASAKIYLADNENDYRVGDRYEATVWGARRWSDWLSTSLRAKISHWQNITGADPDITTTVPGGPLAGTPLIPTADTRRRGGTRVDLSLGFNVLIPNTGARLAIEGGIPLYQNLDGPQLGAEYFVTAGVQYAF